VLGLKGEGVEQVIREAFGRVPPADLPRGSDAFVQAVLERERAAETYLGRGIAAPRARVDGLKDPVLILARAEEGVPGWNRGERVDLIFLLLTATESPGDQVRLLERIARLVESGLVTERLRVAEDPEDVLDTIRAAESVGGGST